jgi:hypothetical protein
VLACAAVRLPIISAFVLAGCGESSTMTGDAQPMADAAAACEGACKTTNLTASLATLRTLDLAYYGVNVQDGTLRVEAYKRAQVGCPTMNSPTPDYTLVLGKLTAPPAAPTSPANILDFKGDLLGGPLGLGATMVTITPVAYEAGAFIALDVDLTFSAGTIQGHLYATLCDSLGT